MKNSNLDQLQKVNGECQSFSFKEKNSFIKLIKAQEAVNDANTKLQETIGKLKSRPHLRSLIQGIESVEKVMEHLRQTPEDRCTHKVSCQRVLNEYHGIVGNLLNYGEDVELALNVTLGNKVFNHITDSAAVAQQILYWMRELQLPGEAYILGMDKLLVRDFDWPEVSNVRRMLDLVDYPEHLEPAFKVSYNTNYPRFRFISQSLILAPTLPKNAHQEAGHKEP